MAEIPKSVSEQLELFRKTKSLDALDKAVAAADALPSGGVGGDPASAALRKKERLAKLHAWLTILSDLDSAIDPAFDPKDVPAATVVPPAAPGGPVLDSGIAPESVRDPQARQAYEQAIAANRQKAERYKLQTALRKAGDRVVSRVGIHAKAAYRLTGTYVVLEDKEEVAAAVRLHIAGAARKADLAKALLDQ